MIISLLLPTRGRPKKLERFWNSVKNTVSDPSRVEIVIVADNNDPETIQAAKNLTGLPKTLIIEDQKYAVEKWNLAASRCTGDFMSPQGDDIVFETKDWDLRIVKEFEQWPSGIGLVCCEDMTWHGKLATNLFISREWYLTAGLFPDGLIHNFCDCWMDDIAKIIERRQFIPDVVMRHIHPAFNKSESWDDTYMIQEPHKQSDKDYYINSVACRGGLAGRLMKRIREMEN